MQLIDASTRFLENAGGQTVIHRQVSFDSDFMDSLKSERLAKRNMRAAEMDRVASVPAHVADIWIRQGFDFWSASPREIVARLQSEGLGDFVTTPKRV